MTATDAASGLQAGWQSFLEVLATIPKQLHLDVAADDPQLTGERVQQLAMIAAQAYPILFSQDPRHPQLVPFTTPVFRAGTNPDFNYLYAALDGRASYTLSGNRGTSLFVHVVQNAGMLGLHEQPGPPLASLDIDTLYIARDGSSCVLLPAHRPDGYRGDWWPLDERSTSISIRQASNDWIKEIDGRFALECLDLSELPSRQPPETSAKKLEEIGRFVVRYVNALGHMRRALAGMPANTLHLNTWGKYGGLSSQYYYQGRFEFEDHEALVIETRCHNGITRHRTPRQTFQCTGLDDQADLRTVTGPASCRRALSCRDLADPGVPNFQIRPVITVDFCRDAGSKPIRVRCRQFGACSSAEREHLPRETPASMRSTGMQLRVRRVRNSGASGELARRVILAVAAG
jgi:hypothetical protein